MSDYIELTERSSGFKTVLARNFIVRVGSMVYYGHDKTTTIVEYECGRERRVIDVRESYEEVVLKLDSNEDLRPN